MTDDTLKQEREIAAGFVDGVRRGDGAAETQMVERYSRGLRYLLRRKTRNTQLAEDLLQETWAIALVKIREKGLDNPGRLAGYLAGIANNLAIGEQRRVNRQRTAVNSEIVALIPDESESPFRQAARAEICKQVQEILADLKKERDREILQRFYVREEDKASICHRLGVDSVHFNRVLYRARQRMKSAVLASGRRSQFQVIS